MTPRRFTLPPNLCICRDPHCKISFGFCHCGCGEKTNIADRTSHKIGWVEGMPTRFVIGHSRRHARANFTDAVPFKIDGVYCKLLGLTRGLYAIVDASEYESLKLRRYYAIWADHSGFYAVRHSKTYGKKMGPTLYLHRELLGLPPGEPTQGDHKNGNTLDCRDKNIRLASHAQNMWNQKTHSDNTSGRTGVHWRKDRNCYTVQLKYHGKCFRQGGIKTFEEACAIREKLERKYHGDFVRDGKPISE
jgi:hypothetical protein